MVTFTLTNLLSAATAALLFFSTSSNHVVLAAQLTRVSYPNNATSKPDMYIYVPDRLAPSPAPLVVVVRMSNSCCLFPFMAHGSCLGRNFAPELHPSYSRDTQRGMKELTSLDRLVPVLGPVLLSELASAVAPGLGSQGLCHALAVVAAPGHVLGRVEPRVAEPRRRRG